jgi:hypothetical protein
MALRKACNGGRQIQLTTPARQVSPVIVVDRANLNPVLRKGAFVAQGEPP